MWEREPANAWARNPPTQPASPPASVGTGPFQTEISQTHGMKMRCRPTLSQRPAKVPRLDRNFCHGKLTLAFFFWLFEHEKNAFFPALKEENTTDTWVRLTGDRKQNLQPLNLRRMKRITSASTLVCQWEFKNTVQSHY